MKKFSNYYHSNIDWLGNIPEGWNLITLKFLSDVMPSNVDKKSQEGEAPVLLCNYVDVYKNNFITSNLQFMEATASDTQIEKFSLVKDDVIATKDSEDPNDIAVPALVVEELQHVVCGYHLTLIRTFKEKLSGNFLFWLLSSQNYNQYFSIEAKGVTRYGVGTYSFKNIKIAVPPIQVQHQISACLNEKTVQIASLILKKEKLIELLNEERTAMINQAVTKGINPNINYKDSGVEWLGEIPEHWEVKKLKYVAFVNQASLSENTEEDYQLEYIDIGGVNPNGSITTQSLIFKDAPSRARRIVKEGDVIVSTVRTYLKAIAKIKSNAGNLIASTGFAVISAKSEVSSDFLFMTAKSEKFIDTICSVSKGVSYPSVTTSELMEISIWYPSLEEQYTIIDYVHREESRISKIISRIQKEIELLKEYKTALISEVVTGKVDVRDEVIAESSAILS